MQQEHPDHHSLDLTDDKIRVSLVQPMTRTLLQKKKKISFKTIVLLVLLSLVLLLCVINIYFLLYHTTINPRPFLLLPTSEGFANNYLNVNDAWYEFAKKRGRKISILRTRVPHYENIHFCVGDYIILPPGVECSDLLADDLLQGANTEYGPVSCKYPKGFYKNISWFTGHAESWLSEIAQFMMKSSSLDDLKGVKVTEEATWDYRQDDCGLYRYTNYQFSNLRNFPVEFTTRILKLYYVLYDILTDLNDAFLDPFVVVHWRRGDEITRYYEGEKLPLNCQSVEEFVSFLQKVKKLYSLSDNFYISTNEQNLTALRYLEDHGYYTYSSIISTRKFKSLNEYYRMNDVEKFLFDVNMMADSGMFLYFGNTKIPLLVERLMLQRNYTVEMKKVSINSGHNESQTYIAHAYVNEDLYYY